MPQQAWSAKRERQYKHIRTPPATAVRVPGAPRRSPLGRSTRTVRSKGNHGPRARRPLRTSRLSTAVANGPARAKGLAGDQGPALQRSPQTQHPRRSTMTKKQLENALGR